MVAIGREHCWTNVERKLFKDERKADHLFNDFKVVLGIAKLNHARLSDPRISLSLHNPFIYLSPELTERRSLGNHLV